MGHHEWLLFDKPVWLPKPTFVIIRFVKRNRIQNKESRVLLSSAVIGGHLTIPWLVTTLANWNGSPEQAGDGLCTVPKDRMILSGVSMIVGDTPSQALLK